MATAVFCSEPVVLGAVVEESASAFGDGAGLDAGTCALVRFVAAVTSVSWETLSSVISLNNMSAEVLAQPLNKAAASPIIIIFSIISISPAITISGLIIL